MQLNGFGKLKWPLVSRLHFSMVEEKYNLNDLRKQHFSRKTSSIPTIREWESEAIIPKNSRERERE